jgi:hypothetical protein
MKVRALVSFASAIICPSPGDVFEVSDQQALDWIKAGLVVREPPSPETAVRSHPEAAVLRRGRR